tara:strand:- start:109 stop:462 length:354 start_codon:yes stop_codon:yes gene_type:complete
MIRYLIIGILVYLLFSCWSKSVLANDINLTIDNLTDGGSLDLQQDGQNNDIDFDIVSMDGFIIEVDQIGNNNTLDVNVDGRTSNGSSMYFNQIGNNKSYSNTLWCGHSFCTITVTQN